MQGMARQYDSMSEALETVLDQPRRPLGALNVSVHDADLLRRVRLTAISARERAVDSSATATATEPARAAAATASALDEQLQKAAEHESMRHELSMLRRASSERERRASHDREALVDHVQKLQKRLLQKVESLSSEEVQRHPACMAVAAQNDELRTEARARGEAHDKEVRRLQARISVAGISARHLRELVARREAELAVARQREPDPPSHLVRQGMHTVLPQLTRSLGMAAATSDGCSDSPLD